MPSCTIVAMASGSTFFIFFFFFFFFFYKTDICCRPDCVVSFSVSCFSQWGVLCSGFVRFLSGLTRLGGGVVF